MARGGGEASSGRNEGGIAIGMAVKRCVGTIVGTTGISGVTKAPARWQSTQCAQLWPKGIFAVADLSWHDAIAPFCSSEDATMAPSDIDIDPDSGMTTAIAPAAGSQAIIHINSNFRKNVMLI